MKLSRTSLGKVWTSISKYGLRAGIKDAAARWAQSSLNVPYDILDYYGWILGQNRPAKLPAPKTKNLTINWLVPGIGKGAGGLLTLFRAVYFLEQWGHKSRIYIVGRSAVSTKQAKEIVREHYFPLEAEVHDFNGEVADSDALVATGWTTAYAARAIGNTAQKYYFVQDLEYLFFPEGSLREFAKRTYEWNFQGITAGDWIAVMLQKEFGMECTPFGFSFDREAYFPNETAPRRTTHKRVAFYARPGTEWRGFELGVLALSIVAKKMPDTEFILVGDARLVKLPFRATLPGVLSSRELGALYRSCDAALVLSHTNLSLLPLELMASGCAVVSNSGANVEWLVSNEVAQLADRTPESLADAILTLLSDDGLRAQKVASGLALANGTDWETEIRKIEAALHRGLNIRRSDTVPE